MWGDFKTPHHPLYIVYCQDREKYVSPFEYLTYRNKIDIASVYSVYMLHKWSYRASKDSYKPRNLQGV